MKNIRKNQLRKCLFLGIDEYDNLIKTLFGNNISVLSDWEGLYYENMDNEYDEIDLDTIQKALSDYYEINVISVHVDDCEYPGVWIVYK